MTQEQAKKKISIHSLRMEGDFFHLVRFVNYRISIHSLRMEGDLYQSQAIFDSWYFNPLPPHGGRLVDFLELDVTLLFQSTPSAWRETLFQVRPVSAV